MFLRFSVLFVAHAPTPCHTALILLHYCTTTVRVVHEHVEGKSLTPHGLQVRFRAPTRYTSTHCFMATYDTILPFCVFPCTVRGRNTRKYLFFSKPQRTTKNPFRNFDNNGGDWEGEAYSKTYHVNYRNVYKKRGWGRGGGRRAALNTITGDHSK